MGRLLYRVGSGVCLAGILCGSALAQDKSVFDNLTLGLLAFADTTYGKTDTASVSETELRTFRLRTNYKLTDDTLLQGQWDIAGSKFDIKKLTARFDKAIRVEIGQMRAGFGMAGTTGSPYTIFNSRPAFYELTGIGRSIGIQASDQTNNDYWSVGVFSGQLFDDGEQDFRSYIARAGHMFRLDTTDSPLLVLVSGSLRQRAWYGNGDSGLKYDASAKTRAFGDFIELETRSHSDRLAELDVAVSTGHLLMVAEGIVLDHDAGSIMGGYVMGSYFWGGKRGMEAPQGKVNKPYLEKDSTTSLPFPLEVAARLDYANAKEEMSSEQSITSLEGAVNMYPSNYLKFSFSGGRSWVDGIAGPDHVNALTARVVLLF
ncbi:hypothetical protein GCM10017044_23890 [Kordiimonas sediminis]|uniref:Porin n=1 Tax=Kordiimonas sediminis TaxID=1735581 RepID=A0A919AVB0_9PROT|nr:porin [Kordiimonas sediminis]GHF27942.1 hypothetical protein GCM10017044_23890 [Kordiimonas sediminis]